MRFLTYGECEDRIKGRGLGENVHLNWDRPDLHTLSCAIPFDNLKWFSRFIAHSCEPFDQCLLWLGESVWPSSENLHLYYRLRQSYGDVKLKEEAPGHLFLNYEFEDLATFVQLCLMYLWDAQLQPDFDNVSVLLSHDEAVDFRAKDASLLEPIRNELVSAKVEIRRLP